MTHGQTSAMWLARWQGLRSSGLKMAEYARREGFNAHSAYRWLRRARRSGQWSDSATQSGKAITLTKPTAGCSSRVWWRSATRRPYEVRCCCDWY